MAERVCLPADSVCLRRVACMGNGTDACGCQTYKIVENKAANKKYLLHQRGCTKSTDATVTALKAEAAYAGEFDIPLKSVAIASTTYFPFMGQIGERPAMRVYDSFTAGHGTTPCMQKQWADGWIKLKSASDAATVEATFGSTATGAGAIVMSDTAEPTFYGMSEWAEFMALWFNREQVDGASCAFPRAHA